MPRTVGLEEAVQPFRETGRREVSRLSVRRAQEQKPVMEKALAAIRAASALSVVLTAQGREQTPRVTVTASCQQPNSISTRSAKDPKRLQVAASLT
jgi:hypothetical protein